jgi:glycosyltransferase involved in cell wall biosynthesis
MKKKNEKTIGVFLNAFWIHERGMSGGDQMAIQIFRRIHNQFTNLYWFSNSDGQHEIKKFLPDASFSTTPIWFDQLPIVLSYILRTVLATIRLLATRVDIIYSGSDFFPDVLPAWLYCKLYPHTIWVQCIFHIYPNWQTRPGNKWVNLIASKLQKFSLFLARQANGIVNINYEVRRYLIERGFDVQQITVITPGIDIEMIESIQPVQCVEDHYDAVFLGRLNHSKGIFDLPDIWQRVIRSHPDARLAVIGGGDEKIRESLVHEFESAGVADNACLLGFIETEYMYAILKKAHVFIFPSYEEGFGIAIVEALACGLPVVAWNLPVYQELFGDVVRTTRKGDKDSIASLIIEDIGKSVNPARKDRLINCAKKYEWNQVAYDMGKWLHDVAGRTVY